MVAKEARQATDRVALFRSKHCRLYCRARSASTHPQSINQSINGSERWYQYYSFLLKSAKAFDEMRP